MTSWLCFSNLCVGRFVRCSSAAVVDCWLYGVLVVELGGGAVVGRGRARTESK